MALKKNTKEKLNMTTVLKRVAKIEALPKNVKSSIPFIGLNKNGMIETSPGTFSRIFKISDINYRLAPDDEKRKLHNSYMKFINQFETNTKWQFTIFNHKIDKRKVLEDIRIEPQSDGLNTYRAEMNSILLDNLKGGNNSVIQDKYLTLSINDTSVDHATKRFNILESQTAQSIEQIGGSKMTSLNGIEAMKLLYSIYNQDNDYRFATGIYNGKEEFRIEDLIRLGLDIKDVIGPNGFKFSDRYFEIGDQFGMALYLDRTPGMLTADFMSEISDLQCNMLLSATSESIDKDTARNMIKRALGSIEAKASDIQKRNANDGLITDLPADLKNSREKTREILDGIDNHDQNLFYTTLVCVIFAESKELLDKYYSQIINISKGLNCVMKPVKFQQEFALNTALPLCRNDLFVERLNTTASESIYIPYNIPNINQKHAIFYGLNQVSKSMILYNRLESNNFNGLVFGSSGSGKSFTAKIEMVSVLLNHRNAQVFIIDPQEEYLPLAEAFHGTVIKLKPGSHTFINPLDLDITEIDDDDSDPIALKVDEVIALFGILMSPHEISPEQRALIEYCVKKIYEPYLDELKAHNKTCDLTKCPTLATLYEKLDSLKKDEPEAKSLAGYLRSYAVGTFDTFARRTNVKTTSKLVIYNIKGLGKGMKELGLYICTNNVWNQMYRNRERGIYTWFYIDEFHVLLESPNTCLTLSRIWKMARKLLGVPTGITQNIGDLAQNAYMDAIINNTDFILIMGSSLNDRLRLQKLLSLSDSQLDYIDNPNKGFGLLYHSGQCIPFGFKFPKDTALYKAMSTSNDTDDQKSIKESA